MKTSGYGATLAAVADRAAAAIVARGNIRSDAARATLLRRLAALPGHPDSLIAPPVFEAARVWQAAETDMQGLAGSLLRADLVDALAEAGAEAIPRDRHPYWHQHAAWTSAAQGRSYMVTSGTGSGKTECFMVPMLNDILDQSETGSRHGVRGLILYPLNALIDSQRERLGSWIAPFAGKVSYALYNRDTPERPGMHKSPAPAEIGNRKALRETPANLLVTNVTMLEYMLTRTQDRGILEKSQGKLRWIVLDEAHTYVGAQAAEMALLLRRVRQAFGVRPEDVRLVATSATIGEGEATEKALKTFVATLGGVAESQVDVIMGREAPMALPPLGMDGPLDVEALRDADPGALWETLAPHPRVRKVREMLRSGGARFEAVSRVLFPEREGAAETAAETVLDAMAQARPDTDHPALAPWRLNVFERSQAGLWACVDPCCTLRAPELAAEGSDWPFGQIHLFQRESCGCGAPVFEIGACSDCGTPWLLAREDNGAQRRLIQRVQDTEEDDFRLDIEPDDADQDITVGLDVLVGPGTTDRPTCPLRHADSVVRDIDTDEPGHTSILLTAHQDRGCCARAHHDETRVAPQRFGAPFLLGSAIPQLLEAMPRPEGVKGAAPLAGRRLLSFTDSRQGTARFAAKLQQEAERNLTRATIWHAVQATGAGDPVKAAELRGQLVQLRAIPGMESVVSGLEAQLAEAEGGFAPVPWSAMVTLLADNAELKGFAGEVWRGRVASHEYGGLTLAEEPVELAKLFLLREIFRRPKFQNNVETMGMARVCWPELERLLEGGPVPTALAEAAHGSEAWIGLALMAIDTAFRSRLAVHMQRDPVDLAHWISPRQASSQIAAPGQDVDDSQTSRRTHRWPSHMNGKARLVQMIFRLIKGTHDSATDRERCQTVLDALWTALRTSKVLRDADAGCVQLDFSRSALMGLDSAWHCPVTRRLLPYSVAGTTPNDPTCATPMPRVPLPKLPLARPGGITETDRAEVLDWTISDPTVATLRAAGLWTNLHDRAAGFAPFLRAQEHSAQIDRKSLQGYEAAFRKGRINILNCSTTMEMGVDIPNVGTVVNTNVPPAPSNYRQRIGRAGRRGEPWAMSFTFCKDKPLDWQVFRAPETLLQAAIPAPAVQLDSPVMVSRHVNALLLGMFLRREGGLNIKTSIGSFLGARSFRNDDDDLPETWMENPMADQFLDELDKGWGDTSDVREAIALLVQGTALAGQTNLAAGTANALHDLVRHWRSEYERLVDGWRAMPAPSPEKAFYGNRARRMSSEFLMTELARRGFTPSYGFPVDVVSFDHIGKTGGNGPSRQLDIAIRDYAPGSEIVIDGLVHKSEGILPAWSNTADAENLEDLRTRWSCTRCAAFGLSREAIHTCPDCGAEAHTGELLRPSGFLGKRKPHAGYEQVSFVAPDRPKVSASSALWISLADPSVGRVRTSRQGQVLFSASSPTGHGYAICLACGYAEPENGPKQETPLSKSMLKHYPLQPIRNNPRHDRTCPGSDDASRKIRRNVVLGNAITTDVFEWQLRDLPSTEAGKMKAMALAAALREALSKSLGIEAEDMGISAAPTPLEHEAKAMSIFLFDRASGGSGFAPLAQDALPDLVARMADILDCKAGCASGCPECILRGDIQYDQKSMDRPGALETIRSVKKRLALPSELQIFGPGSRVLLRALPDWIGPLMRNSLATDVTLYMHGAPDLWDLRALAARMPRRDEAKISRVVLETARLQLMEAAEKVDLVRFLAECGATLHMLDALPERKGMPVLCHLSYAGETQAVVAADKEAAIADDAWGTPKDGPLILGADAAPSLGHALSAKKLALFNEGNAVQADVGTRLDGTIGKFGYAFWKLVMALRPQAFRDIPLSKVTYTDRYLQAPLPVRLLFEVLRTTPGGLPKDIEVVTAAQRRDGAWKRNTIEDNWAEDRLRRETMQALLPGTKIDIRPKRDCPHPRCLTLEWQDGRSLRINLDQGLGTWKTTGRIAPRFDVDEAPATQAKQLQQMVFEIGNRHSDGIDSPIWVTW